MTTETRTISTPTLETLNNRVSVRDYSDALIDDETLHALLNAARRSPTSSNTQTYSFVVVRDPEKKRVLAGLAGDQKHIETAPVFVAICADLHRMDRGMNLHDEQMERNLEMTLIAVVDASIAGQSLALAAESIGLGTVMIGAMRNHPREVADLLGLPEGVFVVYGLCIGVPAKRAEQKPRLPDETIVHFDTYQPIAEAPLRTYDDQLAAHYRATGRRVTEDAAWTGFNAKRFNKGPRPHMREFLESQGFSLE